MSENQAQVDQIASTATDIKDSTVARGELVTTEAVTKAVQEKIKTDPTFKARLLAALKAGGLEALKAIFDHPAFSIPAETIKGYLEVE